MFTRIERNAYAVLVLLALCAAVVLAPPTPAQAQAAFIAEDTRSDHANARANLSHVVVRSDDSLWSISEGRLGPDAAPQRVADAAERIHALNRGRIGADPDLIFVGQELLIPPGLSEGPAGARARAAKGTTGKAPEPVPGTVAGGAEAKGGEAPETVAQQEARREAKHKAEPVGLPALPDVAVAAPVPAVRAVASDGSPTSPVPSFLRKVRAEVASAASALAESFFAVAADARADGRRLLGLGVLALTLLVAALLAWKLPMKRTTRGDAERWGISSGYYGYYGEAPPAPGTTSFFYRPGSLGDPLGDRGKQDARRQAPQVPGRGRRAVLPESEDPYSASIVRTAETAAGRGRAPKARAVPRNGLALGAHNPEVRRSPRRAHATMRARKLRPRGGAPGGRPRSPAAFGQVKRESARVGR